MTKLPKTVTYSNPQQIMHPYRACRAKMLLYLEQLTSIPQIAECERHVRCKILLQLPMLHLRVPLFVLVSVRQTRCFGTHRDSSLSSISARSIFSERKIGQRSIVKFAREIHGSLGFWSSPFSTNQSRVRLTTNHSNFSKVPIDQAIRVRLPLKLAEKS